MYDSTDELQTVSVSQTCENEECTRGRAIVGQPHAPFNLGEAKKKQGGVQNQARHTYVNDGHGTVVLDLICIHEHAERPGKCVKEERGKVK